MHPLPPYFLRQFPEAADPRMAYLIDEESVGGNLSNAVMCLTAADGFETEGDEANATLARRDAMLRIIAAVAMLDGHGGYLYVKTKLPESDPWVQPVPLAMVYPNGEDLED